MTHRHNLHPTMFGHKVFCRHLLSDKSLNELAKYVHKELGLNSNGCDYNLNNEKCRRCTKLIKEKAKSK